MNDTFLHYTFLKLKRFDQFEQQKESIFNHNQKINFHQHLLVYKDEKKHSCCCIKQYQCQIWQKHLPKTSMHPVKVSDQNTLSNSIMEMFNNQCFLI